MSIEHCRPCPHRPSGVIRSIMMNSYSVQLGSNPIILSPPVILEIRQFWVTGDSLSIEQLFVIVCGCTVTRLTMIWLFIPRSTSAVNSSLPYSGISENGNLFTVLIIFIYGFLILFCEKAVVLQYRVGLLLHAALPNRLVTQNRNGYSLTAIPLRVGPVFNWAGLCVLISTLGYDSMGPLTRDYH